MTTTTTKRKVWAAPLPLTALSLCVGLIALVAAGLGTGLGQAGEISDPGAATRWGLPVARYIHHVAASTAITAAILAAIAIPARAGPRQRVRRSQAHQLSAAGTPQPEHPLYAAVLRIATIAATVWTVSALAVLVLTFSDMAGLPLSTEESFTEGFFDYMINIANGQAWSIVVLIAGTFATLSAGVRNTVGIGFTAALGLCALIPIAMVGHSAGGDDHNAAVDSLGLHLLGVVIWVGGLVTLALLAPHIGRIAHSMSAQEQGGTEILGTLLRRYSLLAGLALFTVIGSGVINAEIRVETFSQLFSTQYGLMLLAKIIGTVILAICGWMHRAWIIPKIAGSHRGIGLTQESAPESQTHFAASKRLWQLITVEIAIMTAVIGISSVLGRSTPPVPEELPPDATPARIITGYELPPEQEFGNFFTLWRFDWLWVAIIVFLAVWYILAMRQLRQRGTRWPMMRAVSWMFGLGVLFWITSGGPAIYGLVTFSGHMVQHMTLTMVSPIFLVMGSPVTLAMRALKPRRDGTRGAREWILWLVHSRFSRFITNPIVAGVNFAGSIVLFYFTPVFGLALEYHLGHVWMTVHFLLTGYIFALVLIGRDPLPNRPPHFMRILMLLATMVFHAFFAVALMSTEQLIEASWFGNIGHGWFPAIVDQNTGGELMWGLGEIPAVLMGVIACVQWARDDTRETKRLDRQADRTGEAELEEYNRMLEDMARRQPR